MHKLKVWLVATRSLCLKRTGRPPIGLRWVEKNRATKPGAYDIRSRLVVQETKRVSTIAADDAGAVFSGMAPLEALRMLISYVMSVGPARSVVFSQSRDDDIVLLFLDVSRAHSHCPMRREVYTDLPPEHPDSVDPENCPLLQKTYNGVREDSQNIHLEIYDN